MREQIIKVYKYDELSDNAKEKARAWWLSCDTGFAWESTKDGAKEIGLELHGTHRGSMTGEFIVSAEACAKSIVKEHGQTCATYATAKAFLDETETLRAMDTDDMTLDQENTLEDAKREFLRSILEDYRVIYEKEEEYEQSEEYIAEAMEANDYEFDEKGRRV